MQYWILTRIALCSVVALVSGCTSFAMKGADPEALQSKTLAERCPLGVPGTRIRADETPGGMDVHFVTRPANVEELRLRVRDQGTVNGPERHRGRGHFGEHHGARDHGLRLWALPHPIRTNVVDTAHGAKLEINATDSDNSERRRLDDDVRRAIRERVAQIESANCF
jgi:hypothetical protein